jgi:phytoene synthase
MSDVSQMDDLRRVDHDRYLSLLYAPEDRRDALATLFAFNAELASIRDRAREALPGEVRIQWWRDLLASRNAEAAGGHPLATRLLGVIEHYRLPVAAFDNMLDARVFDLYDDAMPSRSDLEGYLGETASALIQLSCLVLDAEKASQMGELSGHAGVAQGIAGIVRLLPMHKARGQCFVPAEILAAAGTSREALYTDKAAAGRVVEQMVALGREHWRAFVGGAAALPASLRPAFLPAGLAPAYLTAAERLGADAIDRTANISPLRKQLTMFLRAARGW